MTRFEIIWTPSQADSSNATQTEARVAVPEPSHQALRYYHSGNWLWAVGTGLGFVVPALLLFTGFSARLRNVALRVGRRWLPALALYAFLFILTTAVLTFPFEYYQGFVREHAYGLSNQSLEKWLGDWLKGVGLSGLGLALVLWIPYLLLRRSPERWWLYAGLATIPIATFLLIVSPVWVDPLFNDFGPLKDRALEHRILGVAERAGVSGSQVFQVNKSVDTRTVNAYVTGVGATKRIVLWDTILAKLEPDQVEFVVAHELGHFVLHHVLAWILVVTILAVLSLYVVHRVARAIIARFSRRFGFDRLSDIASLPLLILLGTAVSFVATPLLLAFSRHQEHEADRFALELTRNNRVAATTFVRLQEENLSVPRPGALYNFWRGSHPSLGDRIDFANSYRPWERGHKLRYGRLFR
ncbi:MAG TPA: M48 family metallopeptidase [Gemmatimonadales bacterium]|nr:M48 family metallopeptidase [Gemmatimonadales bacterium]